MRQTPLGKSGIAMTSREVFTRRSPNQIDTLIREFLHAPDDHFLSREDIRQDVMYDEDASDGAIRTLIYEARLVLLKENRRYKIETITRKGYRLCRLEKKEMKALSVDRELSGR
jgi:DNA-binding winged helix-turn-helix (wHTH) protein